MGRPSRYPDELRERAVRMVAELRRQYPSQWAAITAVAGMLGIGTPETLRTWIRRSEVDTGQRPGVTSQMAEENKELRKDIAELRRANEILKAAAIFFGASSTGPGDGDPVHRRTQGPPGGWPRRWGWAALGCRVHVRRALRARCADQRVDLLRVDRQDPDAPGGP